MELLVTLEEIAVSPSTTVRNLIVVVDSYAISYAAREPLPRWPDPADLPFSPEFALPHEGSSSAPGPSTRRIVPLLL